MRSDIYNLMLQSINMNSNELKLNYAEIGRRFNADPRTVKKYYEKVINSVRGGGEERKSKRPSKLDPFKEIIKEKYLAGHTATSIFHFIKDNLGYTGGLTILTDYCRTIKLSKAEKATIRNEVAMGDSAQVDWKESITLETRDGKKVKGNLFLYVLANSRFKYVEFTYKRDQKSFLKCLTHAF